jgi:hypothetical protein
LKHYENAEQPLVDYKPTIKSNADQLWELYTVDQKKKFSTEFAASKPADRMADRAKKYKITTAAKDLEINVGTVLYIPKNKANLEVLTAQGKDLFMKQQDLVTFMGDEIKALINDPSYVRSARVSIKGSRYSVDYLDVTFNCRIYVRSLGKILNITPFVRAIDTNVSDGGGTFSLSMNDIMSIEDVRKYSETYYSYVYKVTNGTFNLSFFQKYIQQNDIVFIRFERLDIEGDADVDGKDFEIMESSLPGKVYDMIGLVDDSGESYTASQNVSVLNISGRDLTKLIIEDGCYFFDYALINGGKDFFLNYDPKNTMFKRLINGQFSGSFISMFHSIRDSLGFIFNRLTNTGVLPTDSTLFDAYKNSLNRATGQYEDRTSKTYSVNGANQEYLDAIEQNGLWKIIKVIVDHQIDERRLNNGELSNPEGSIMDLVGKVCLAPFVEFWGDTYGDQFTFIARQAPFTKDQINDYFSDANNLIIDIESHQVSDINLSWDETYYSWFQIQPAEGLFGANQFTAGTRMPIVYFEEFANLFGVHKRVVSDSYVHAGILNGLQEQTDVNIYRQSLANDMQYLIESSVVLPFTRHGSITIVGGDRRIKKGMWIYFRPTNEIYYVKGVANSVAISGMEISRTTTISVERGMIKDYVIGKSPKQINGKNINYFDVVNMGVIKDSIVTGDTGSSSQLKSSSFGSANVTPLEVQLSKEAYTLQKGKYNNNNASANVQLIDKDLFDFFSKRKQWS